MTRKEKFIRLLKHYVELLEKTEIKDDAKISYEVEQIDVTQDFDVVRRFEIGKGRKLTIEWQEK